MSRNVPITLLRHQAPNILGMFGAGLRSALPLVSPAGAHQPDEPVHRRIAPVPESLVATYCAWAGAPAQRYAGALPPHLFSYWGLALISQLTGRAPYNLLSAVNQGCRVATRTPLTAGEAIEVTGRLTDVSDDGRRIRIATRLDAGTASAPDAQCIEVFAAVPRRNPEPRKNASQDKPEPAVETVGHWSASAEDGLDFALLTGDFNPLHTLPPLGRRTRYGSCILHGFGTLARTYEAIRNAGIDIALFDLRFIKPVPLPSAELAVQLGRDSDADGNRALRLRGPQGTLHLAGHFRESE